MYPVIQTIRIKEKHTLLVTTLIIIRLHNYGDSRMPVRPEGTLLVCELLMKQARLAKLCVYNHLWFYQNLILMRANEGEEQK